MQVDAAAQDGATPLQAACAFGAPGAAALLLAHGAHPSPPISDAHPFSAVAPLHLVAATRPLDQVAVTLGTQLLEPEHA